MLQSLILLQTLAFELLSFVLFSAPVSVLVFLTYRAGGFSCSISLSVASQAASRF